MFNRKPLKLWPRPISCCVLLCLFISISSLAVKPAHAWFFPDLSPRVVETNLPFLESAAVNTNTVYIAKKGDTLSKIAKKYQVDLEQLIKLNEFNNPHMIMVGQVIHIPAIGAGDPQPILYYVQQGDTLWDIASYYGVNVKILIQHNNLANPHRLTIGHQLVIPVENNSVPAMSTTNMLASRGADNIRFKWPVQGVITSKFGRRWGEFHYGLDVAANMGTPVTAAAGGMVTFAGWRGTYGKAVIIKHDETYTTLYAHNSEILVQEGEWVASGQTIAKIGSTGRSTGPHLHFEVHQNEKALDPLRFLR